MICRYCKEQIQLSKNIEWTASCRCVSVSHPWMERVVEEHIRAAYKKNNNNPAVPTSNVEPAIKNALD